MQQLDPADAELRAFIVSNTNGNAVPSLINYAGPTTAPPSPTIVNTLPPAPEGTTRVPIVVEGVVYFPLVAHCPAASCTTGDVIAQAIPDAGTNAYTEAVARKVEKELNVATAVVGVGGAVVRGMGVLGEVAGVGGGGRGVEAVAGAGNTVVAAEKEITPIFSATQIDKKFKHAEDFGISTAKKNPETLGQFQQALESHINDPNTYTHGTYQYVPESTIYYNPNTNNVVILDKNGEFISGWKLMPSTPQFVNFVNKGVLR